MNRAERRHRTAKIRAKRSAYLSATNYVPALETPKHCNGACCSRSKWPDKPDRGPQVDEEW